MTIGVYRDHQRRTAIVVKSGNVRTHCVQMDEGELQLRAIPDEQFFSRYQFMADYPIDRAIDHYLNHTGGLSDRARAALAVLVADASESP